MRQLQRTFESENYLKPVRTEIEEEFDTFDELVAITIRSYGKTLFENITNQEALMKIMKGVYAP